MSVLGSRAAAQAAAEYGLSSSSGGLAGIAHRIGDLASTVATELDGLMSFALANPALTILVAALICVAVVVRSTSVR